VRPDLVHRVLSSIRKYRMLSGGEKILIGLSGGPDSVCRVHVLSRLRDSLKLDLHGIYIDHGLRPGETGQEISFCRDFCDGLSVPFITKSIEVKTYAAEQKLNKQEAARLLRYRVFEETVYEVNAHKIALGHTSDDQAETLLMRLFRGAGSAGLAGIPPVRKNIIRPLLDIRRKEIEQYLGDEKVGSVIDSSNLKTDYLRNRIRLSLMPLLREFNPEITDTLAKTAAIFRDEERYFEIIVTKTLMKLISRKTDSRIELFLSPFGNMDKVVMRRVLRRAIDETKGLRSISFIHIEDMIELIQTGDPGDRLFLPKGIRAIKDYSTFILTSEIPATLDTYTLTVPGETILKEAGIVVKATVDDTKKGEAIPGASGLWTAYGIFDADKLRFPLTARPRRDGDAFYPFGFGKRKKLQDFYVDMKVPRDERNRVPLIVSGEDIIWVVGYRGDERFKVAEETKSIVRLELKKTRD
jgi:tRNA(Ile)-lysidine synthase